MTERMAVTDWIARYERAWRSPGTDALDELFTHAASYSPSPWAQPLEGLEAIRRFWDAGRSGPDEGFRMQSEIVAIDAPVAVVRVAVDYDDGQRWRDHSERAGASGSRSGRSLPTSLMDTKPTADPARCQVPQTAGTAASLVSHRPRGGPRWPLVHLRGRRRRWRSDIVPRRERAR
jgi:hypothetical protein